MCQVSAEVPKKWFGRFLDGKQQINTRCVSKKAGQRKSSTGADGEPNGHSGRHANSFKDNHLLED